MVRIARVVLPNVPHHITQRGVRKLPIFLDDEDHEFYLKTLSEMGRKHGVEFCCWCLMKNHVHIVAIPETEESLSKAIGVAHLKYTQYFNEKYGCSGHLFSQRFYSTPMSENHSYAVVGYIHRNPVRAGIVSKVDDYKWSSIQLFLRNRYHDSLVNSKLLLNMVEDWKEIFDEPIEEEELKNIRLATSTGTPYGDKSFIKKVESILGVEFPSKHIGRPPK